MKLSESNCAKIVFDPGEKFAEEKRFWQGCPSIMYTQKGILYAAWYSGGTREPSQFNYNVLVRSFDQGQSWSEPILAIDSIPELAIRAIDIQLWLAPDGKAWLFWVQRFDEVPADDHRHLSVWAITSDNIDDQFPVWSDPRKISEGFLRCQPTVLSDGRYLLFAYDWTSENYQYSESYDEGKTWIRRSGGKKVTTPFDETMAVERKDGSLWMLARSNSGKLAESFSFDMGQTWTDGRPSAITSPSSRFFMKRLKSGRLILAVNNAPDVRTNMTIYLSEDDGKSWPWSLLIDSSEHVSYPDLAEGDDGWLYLVHDRGRMCYKGILLSKFKEQDVMAGELQEGSFLRHHISKAPSEPYDPALYSEQRAIEYAKYNL